MRQLAIYRLTDGNVCIKVDTIKIWLSEDELLGFYHNLHWYIEGDSPDDTDRCIVTRIG
jgi:hypothetical protein